MCFPEHESSFTTAGLKGNFIGTARDGAVACSAQWVHAGRAPTSQIWHAETKSGSSGTTSAWL
jgi:1,4-dihydroxy-2-naphthoyl-CoA hydrolase